MNVRPYLQNEQDKLYLIDFKKFMRIVDRKDLNTRHSTEIEDCYHEHWITLESDNIWIFKAPEFFLCNGTAYFINGRHRTLVLGKHLLKIPMALTGMDKAFTQPTTNSTTSLQQICIRKIENGEIFNFPNLPIRYLGYDANISK